MVYAHRMGSKEILSKKNKYSYAYIILCTYRYNTFVNYNQFTQFDIVGQDLLRIVFRIRRLRLDIYRIK